MTRIKNPQWQIKGWIRSEITYFLCPSFRTTGPSPMASIQDSTNQFLNVLLLLYSPSLKKHRHARAHTHAHTHTHTEQSPSQEANTQPVNKLPTFHGTQRFITTFTRPDICTDNKSMNPVNTLPTYSLKICFNISITELVAITGDLLA